MARTIIIGDIHGCFGELQELLDRVGPVAGDTILSVGDLVDRGPDPRGVVDLFRRPAADGVERRAICGNHERKHIRGVLSHSQQIARLQLGQVRPDRAFDEGRYAEDVAWMAGLPFHVETPEFRVVHWGLYPGVPLAEVPEDVRAGTTSGDAKLQERTVAEILAWAEAVRAEIPALADRLDGALAALQAEFPDPDAFGAGASAHPAGSWLLRLHRGRLSREHLGCESPRAVFTLAAALGATLSAPERP